MLTWQGSAGGCQIVQPGTTVVGAPLDPAGAFSEATLIVNAPPAISNVVFDRDRTHLENATSRYRQHPSPHSVITRRDGKLYFSVDLDDTFSDECFEVAVVLANTFDGAEQRLRLPLNGTPVNGWKADRLTLTPITNTNGLRVTGVVHTAPTASIGRYTVSIQLATRGGLAVRELASPISLVVMFNPYSALDQVYADHDTVIVPFLTRETGWMWQGSWPAGVLTRSWRYIQFGNHMWMTAIDLLQGLTSAERTSPVLVARRLSARLNSNDDGGVLVGMWDFRHLPSAAAQALQNRILGWAGSGAIFGEYRSTATPVSAGQCWCFAGILTSALRGVGIPSRPITNFESGHDENGDLKITRVYECRSAACNELDRVPSASEVTWNFHVWCEAWMGRPDRPGVHGGWQVVDATPQELSGGLMQCGPAPVSAVKQRVGGTFDVNFVRAEVDGEVVRKRRRPDGTLVNLAATDQRIINQLGVRDRRHVGYGIRTLAPGARFAHPPDPATASVLDRTLDYKAAIPPLLQIPVPAGSGIPDSIKWGTDFVGEILLENPSQTAAATIIFGVSLEPMDNSGTEVGAPLLTINQTISIAAGGHAVVPLYVSHADLAPYYKKDAAISGRVWARLDGDLDNIDMVETVTPLLRPAILLQLSATGDLRPQSWVRLRIQTDSPLIAGLTNAELVISGDFGVVTTVGEEQRISLGNLAPGSRIDQIVWLRAIAPHDTMVAVHLNAAEIRPSENAVLATVLSCAVDFNGSGGLGVDDLFTFLAVYFAESSLPCEPGHDADINGDGCVSVADLFNFLALYFAGC